jgi:hypothetical protein
MEKVVRVGTTRPEERRRLLAVACEAFIWVPPVLRELNVIVRAFSTGAIAVSA